MLFKGFALQGSGGITEKLANCFNFMPFLRSLVLELIEETMILEVQQ